MKTLVTDEFAEGEPEPTPEPVDSHDIIYGALGFTDTVDAETIQTLVGAGVIVLDRYVGGSGWSTRIYRSVQANY